jgi:anaphase-promoting complex subunit 3
LGQEYFFLDDLDKASENFKKASLLNSRQFFAWCGLGTVSLKSDRFKEALDYFVKAMCLNRKCSVVYSYIGICWINLNDPAKALNNFKKSEELDPKNTMNIYQKANSLYLLKEYNSALFELEKLKRENAHNESLVYLLYGRETF